MIGTCTDMKRMFNDARAFNQPLNNWNVSNVTNMRWMLLFVQPATQQLERVQREHYGTDVLDRNILQPAAQQLGRVLRGGYGLDVYGLIVLQPTAQ